MPISSLLPLSSIASLSETVSSTVSARVGRLVDRAAVAIEEAEGLDAVAAAVQSPTRKLPAGPVKDALSGVAAGHPLHPVLVTVPIGALCSAAVLDATGQQRAAARTLTGLGLLSSLPAALAGLSDWSDTQGAERRVGLVHLGLNVAGLGLVAASWVARRGEHHDQGLGAGPWLGLAGLGVIGMSGWLGGHLSYALGVGVDTTAFLRPPSEWTDVIALSDLEEDQPQVVMVDRLAVLLVRRYATVHAMFNRCTHRGGPLCEGPFTETTVECPWHGSVFALEDGSVVRGPSTRPAPVLKTRIMDGRVEVRRVEPRGLRTDLSD